MVQTYAHHLLGIAGASCGLYVGGFIGSVSQLTWITEASTPLVNLRWILADHKMSDGFLYVFNGVAMTVVFFFCRVIFYYYIIFAKLIELAAYRYMSFWATYPEEKHFWVSVSIALYCMMYVLNLFWFSKMLQGLCKASGLLEAIGRTERRKIE